MTDNKVKYEYFLSDIPIINSDEKINKITELIENSQNIGSVNVFLKKVLKKESDEDDPLKPTKSAFEITTELKVFFVYNKDRYLTDMLFEKGKEQIEKINPIEKNSQDKEYLKNELSSFIHDSNTINNVNFGNGLKIELCHGLIFLEQNQNIIAICRKPKINISPEERYEETFENIDRFIEEKTNSNFSGRLFLIPVSTQQERKSKEIKNNAEDMIEKTNISGAWHTNLLVANDRAFSRGQMRNFLLENCNLFDSNIDGYKESEQKLILEITFPSKERDKCPYVISTPFKITKDGCAIGAIGAAMYFSEKIKNGKELETAIFLISRTKEGMEDLLNHIDSIRNIQDMSKNTDLYSYSYAFKNQNKENGTILEFHKAFQDKENRDTNNTGDDFYRDYKDKVKKDVIPYISPSTNSQTAEQIQDEHKQTKDWQNVLKENRIIKPQNDINIKKPKTKCNII